MIFSEDAIDELRSLGDIVRWAASRFNEAELSFGHGADNSMDEAFFLVCHSLNLPHDIPPYMINSRLTKAERRTAINLILQRISTRKPAAYILQQAWFAGIPFYVDERVLIPRSPIAELITTGFQPWLKNDEPSNILDMCTGGGCIAIACALAFVHANVDATDISKDALDVAHINVKRHGLEEQVRLVESDVFKGLDKKEKKYDLIVSNPPYVNAKDMAMLTPEFQHEPPLALRAGLDGLKIVKSILQQAADYLTDDGLLVVETGNSYVSLLEQFPQVPFIWPEFEHGGQGVFMLSAADLREHQSDFDEALG